MREHPRAILAGSRAAVEDERLFLDVLAMGLFEAGHFFKLPRAIHSAAKGDMAPWNQMIADGYGEPVADRLAVVGEQAPPLRLPAQRGGGPSYVAPGTYVTVTCAEEYPNSAGLPALRAIAASTTWGLGDSLNLAEACQAWRVEPAPASVRQPVVSSARLLLLNGDLDLDTFPEWGAHVAERLPGSASVAVPFATHSTMSIPCVADVASAFLVADGDVTQVDLSCLKALQPPPW